MRQLDLLQIGSGGCERPVVWEWKLRSDAKGGMNAPASTNHIALRQPPDLPLPDQMHGFVTIDRPQCSFCPIEVCALAGDPDITFRPPVKIGSDATAHGEAADSKWAHSVIRLSVFCARSHL